MSTGPFEDVGYIANDGSTVQSIRIQPETRTLTIGGVANTPSGDLVNNDRGVSASGRRSILFTTARRLNVRVIGIGDSDYTLNEVLSIPWFNPATFLTVTRPRAQEGTYNGADVRVIGSSPER